jgi:FkbM family methyltransferase
MPIPVRVFENDHIAVKYCRHGIFAYNVNDTFVGRSLDLYGEWAEPELDLLRQVLKAGDVVVDAGANIGTHTVFFAKQVTDAGSVYAFEPQRLTFQNLCANVALNALVNVSCRQQALGNRSATERIAAIDPRRPANYGGMPLVPNAAGETADIVKLDNLALSRCNLIKVDVEGMECEVLEGAQRTIESCRPILFVENNTLERSSQIIRRVQSFGYQCFWQIHSYFSPRNYFANEHDVFQNYNPEANMICFPGNALIGGLERVLGETDNCFSAAQRIQRHGA